MQAGLIAKDLTAQHNLTDDEYQRIVDIFECELICIGMDS